MLNALPQMGLGCRPAPLRRQPCLFRARSIAIGAVRTPLGAQLWRWSAVPLPPRRTGSTRLFATAESDTADDLRLVYEVGGKPVLLADLNLEEKKELYVRLCENDIDYNQMKNLCKDNNLGGKDSKYNLRAKLIRYMRQLLGMVLWDKASYGKKPKRPNEMTSAELDKFFQQRGVVRPDALDEAHGLAFAMLVVDGIIPQSEVPPTSPYDRLTLDALKEELKKRGLPVSGNKKDDCVRRLLLYDEAQELEKQHRRAKAAAEKERIEASIYVPPRPPPGPMGQDLREAQAAIAAIGKMDLPELRAALLARRLPVYGTREVLVERLMNILRKAVIDAHAGFRRLVNYAQAAVSKLSDEEVYEALAKRGLVSHSASQESTARLANSLVEDWIQMAMFPTPDGDNGWSDSPASDDDEGDEGASGLADPTLEVALVCGGATVDERSAALASARTSLPQLQSDLVWGTLLNDTIAAPMDDVPGNGEAPAQEPPRDAVSIDFITNPVPNGVVVSLSVPWAPPGCSFIVTATPVDGGQVVTAEGRTQDVLVLGLQPRTEYNFTARLRNAAGYGPESEPYYEATFVRHGVSVKVYYSVPVQTSAGEEWRYVQLSWKQVLAATAEELDARLGASLAAGGLGSSSLAELADTADVLVPLGLLPSEEEIQHQACATSWASQELRKLAASRPAFTQAASSLGFPATSLLELPAFDAEDPSSVTYASARITSWLQAQGADPVTARVAVRVEQGTSVLGAGIGRGVEKIVIGAAALCEEHVAASVVLEQVMPGAVFFTVAVLQSPESGRPVALTPTEVSYKDLEEEFMAFELRLDRFFAVNGGQDPEKVDALMALMLEESQLHPAIMGGQASASQHIVHATPPSSLPASTVENIRAAAAKLFVDLEIRDFAQFSGWVVPDDPVAAAGLGPAMDLWAQVNAGEAQGGVNDNGAAPQPSKGKTFAELAQIDAAERAALAAEMRSVGGAGVTAEDIAGAVDVEIYTHEADKDEPDAALANGPVLREVGESLDSAPVRYGKFAGFELGDLTREDLKAARVVEPATPIPNGLPEVSKPTELGDLSALDPGALCRTPSGIITFNQVCLTADLGNRLSPLAQQMAVAGLPYSALARQLVSWAASRAGLPPLPPTPALLEDPEVAEDWPIGRGLDAPEETLPSGPSMDEIGAAIESWAVPEAQPLPESYEDIRTNGALVSESDEEADAAAAAAGLDADVAVAATVEALNNDSGTDDDDGDMVMPPSDAVVLAQRFPGLHPTRQRVWILCGGEGPLKDGSLHAAVHAMAALHGAPDLLIETFFLDPPFAGAKDFERRRRLLQHRLDLHKLGATDEQLLEEAPEFHPNHIRHPATPPPQDIGRRGVWRLAGSSVVRESVPDMKDGCEDAISTASVHPVSRREGDGLQGLEQLLATTRGELELAGLPAGGPAPWGGILSTPQPPHYSFMGDWVEAAAQQCTVVLLALPGHPSAQGSLQQMLEERGVPFTGPASVAADLCADRYQMITTLSQLQYDGSMINLPLVHNISAPELEKQCETERGAEEFFSHLFGDWPDKMMIIRPARCAGGLGVARIASGEDLRTYAAAVKQWAEVIPQEYLTSAVADVDMPLPPPTQFVVEPFLPATPLELKVDDGEGENAAVASNSSGDDAVHRRLSWPTKDSWLAVRACMLGDAGAMRCLGLSTEVIKVAREADGEDVVVGSFDLNPPPAHILHPAMAADAHARMALIADRLGLSGAAEISALISATDGGLVVLDIDPHPDISPEGLLMRQAAAAATNPLEPRDVLRELLKVGMSRGEDLGGNLSLGMDSASLFSSEDYVGDAPAALDGKDPPSPALQWYGDAYEKIEFTADEDDEDEEFVAQQARGASKKRFTNNDAYEELLPDEDDDGDGTTGEDGDDLDLPEEGALDG